MNLAFTDEIGSGFKYWGEKKKKEGICLRS